VAYLRQIYVVTEDKLIVLDSDGTVLQEGFDDTIAETGETARARRDLRSS
jgi:hypothetical protein